MLSGKRERVALHDADIAEGFKRIAFLIKHRAVAVQPHPGMVELHVSAESLRVGQIELMPDDIIGINQLNHLRRIL